MNENKPNLNSIRKNFLDYISDEYVSYFLVLLIMMVVFLTLRRSKDSIWENIYLIAIS